MSQQVIMPNRNDGAEKSVQEQQGQLSSRLVVALLVILGVVLFIGAYLLSWFVLTEWFEDIPAIPVWIPILIVILDILWIVLIKFYPIRHRAKVILKLIALSVSAGALFAILCVWGLPVSRRIGQDNLYPMRH